MAYALWVGHILLLICSESAQSVGILGHYTNKLVWEQKKIHIHIYIIVAVPGTLRVPGCDCEGTAKRSYPASEVRSNG